LLKSFAEENNKFAEELMSFDEVAEVMIIIFLFYKK